MFNFFRKSLINILPQVRGKYQKDVPLSKHTWFGVGGPAEVMFHPADAEDLSFFLQNKPYNLPICLIGGGSNLLVRDGGIPGVVIKLDSPAFRKTSLKGNLLTCGAGVKNAELKKIILDNSLGGLEFYVQSRAASAARSKPTPGASGGKSKTLSFPHKSWTDKVRLKKSALKTSCSPIAAASSLTTGLSFPSLSKQKPPHRKLLKRSWKNSAPTG